MDQDEERDRQMAALTEELRQLREGFSSLAQQVARLVDPGECVTRDALSSPPDALLRAMPQMVNELNAAAP